MSKMLAVRILLVTVAAVIGYQALVIAKVMPRDVIAGGRLTSDTQMYLVAGSAIGLNAFFAWLVLQRSGLVRYRLPRKLVSVLMWVFCGFFALNAVANLFSVTTVERTLAIPAAAIAILTGYVNFASRSAQPSA